jgi:hypothetical protein
MPKMAHRVDAVALAEQEREFGEMLGVVSHCCSVRIKRTIASLLYCSRFVKQNKKEERNNQSWQWRPSLDVLVPLFAYHHREETLAVFWANASFQYHPSVWSFDGSSLLEQIFVRAAQNKYIRYAPAPCLTSQFTFLYSSNSHLYSLKTTSSQFYQKTYI